MTQYEFWWAEFPAPIGRRPVLLLSRASAYPYLNRVLAVEITRTVHGIPQEVGVGRREGLSAPSVANFDNLQALDKRWLTRRIGALPRSRVPEVKTALAHVLGWPELLQLD